MSRKEEKEAREAVQILAETVSDAATRARAAFARGDGYFEFTTDLRALGELASYAGPGALGPGPTDILSRIEAEGWALLQANHVYMLNGERTYPHWKGGEQTSVDGQIAGVYLFRRAGAPGRPGPTVPPGRPMPPGPPGPPVPPGAPRW